jgi:hypothetical protein
VIVFSDVVIERLVRGRPATDEPPFGAGRDAIDAHLRSLLGELGELEGVELVVEGDGYRSGDATFIEAFAWPADGSSIARPQRSLAQTLREGTPEIIDGLTILVSRLAPCAVVGPRTLPRMDRIRFELPIGLGTAAWIEEAPKAGLATFASGIRSGLECLGLTACTPAELLQPIAFQGPLDRHGSLMNLGGPNRVFDALFRWCD